MKFRRHNISYYYQVNGYFAMTLLIAALFVFAARGFQPTKHSDFDIPNSYTHFNCSMSDAHYVLLIINKHGSMLLRQDNGQTRQFHCYNYTSLLAQLKLIKKISPYTRILLKADRQTPYAMIYRAFQTIKKLANHNSLWFRYYLLVNNVPDPFSKTAVEN